MTVTLRVGLHKNRSVRAPHPLHAWADDFALRKHGPSRHTKASSGLHIETRLPRRRPRVTVEHLDEIRSRATDRR